MKSIGLDVGNGSTCIVIQGEKGVQQTYFASTYGLYNKDRQRVAIDTMDQTSEVVHVYTLNGRDYVLGYEDVKRVGSSPISTYGREERLHLSGFQTLLRLSLLQAATVDGQTGVIEVALGVGVPNEDYRKDSVELITKWFKEPLSGAVDGQQVVVMVKNVEVLSQPIAVLVDEFYDDQGFVRDQKVASENVLVIDSGSGTLDMSEFREMKLQNEVSEAIGMNDVYQQVIEAIEKRDPKFRVDAYDLEYQIRSQQNNKEIIYRQGISTLPITDVYQQAMDDVWNQMVGRIERRYPDRKRFDRVLLAGGTGDAFADRFQKWVPQIRKTKEPQMAIARGLCKYAIASTETEEAVQ